MRRFREFESSQEVLGKRLPIIGMSANSDDETRKASLEIGMDSFVAKPVNCTSTFFYKFT